MMPSKRRLDLNGAPLSATVLTARRYRLQTRWGECLLVSIVLAAAFAFALWSSLCAESPESSTFGSVAAVVLALLLLCALQTLVLNFIERTGLLPATPSQLELTGAAREVPAVAHYMRAVAAHKRGLNRKEAAAIIAYVQLQPLERKQYAEH